MIGARVLFHDFFVGELKPDRMNENSIVFRATGKPCTATIIRNQVQPVHDALNSNPPQWADAQDHTKRVATAMRGFLGLYGPEREDIALEVRQTVQTASAMSFHEALGYIASAVQPKVRGRRPISAISKMLQLYPSYANQAVIYDSMVTSVFESMGMPAATGSARTLGYLQAYCSAFAQLLTVPILFNDFQPAGAGQRLDRESEDMARELHDNPLSGYSVREGQLTRDEPAKLQWISIEDFFNHPAVGSEANNGHGWAANLAAFMKRRALDRVLWHMGAIEVICGALVP